VADHVVQVPGHQEPFLARAAPGIDGPGSTRVGRPLTAEPDHLCGDHQDGQPAAERQGEGERGSSVPEGERSEPN
jgi:hypothetical protein